MSQKYLVILIAAALALAACSSPAADLSGSSWSLQTLENQSLVAGSIITIEFNKGELKGSGGCNAYFGGYEISEESLTISQIGSTMMACEDGGISNQESGYFQALGSASSFEIDGDTLNILTGENISLVFTRQP